MHVAVPSDHDARADVSDHSGQEQQAVYEGQGRDGSEVLAARPDEGGEQHLHVRRGGVVVVDVVGSQPAPRDGRVVAVAAENVWVTVRVVRDEEVKRAKRVRFHHGSSCELQEVTTLFRGSKPSSKSGTGGRQRTR